MRQAVTSIPSIYLVGSQSNAPSIVIPRSYYSDRSQYGWPFQSDLLLVTFKARAAGSVHDSLDLEVKSFSEITIQDFMSIILGRERIVKLPINRWYDDLEIDDRIIGWLVRYHCWMRDKAYDEHYDTTKRMLRLVSNNLAPIIQPLLW